MISISKARYIDRKIGQPLCRIAGWVNRRIRQAPDAATAKTIVIIKMWGMGSIILGSPVIRSLRVNCPQAKIILLTLDQNRNLYEGSPWLDRILTLQTANMWNLVISTFEMVRRLRRMKIDFIFDFEFGSRFTALLTVFSGARYTVGYAPAGSGKNVFDLTVPFHESVFLTRIFLRTIERLGWEVVSEEPIRPAIQRSDRETVDAFLGDHARQRFIAINPNSSELARERQWPLTSFAALIRDLLTLHPDYNLVLVGGPADVPRCEKLAAMSGESGRILIAAGKLTIRQSFLLLEQGQLLISNDSGPMHLGLLAGTRTIGLFGPETPLIYGWPNPLHVTLLSHETCSPCISVYNDKVVDCPFAVKCMTNISVEQVLATARKFLPVAESVTGDMLFE